MTNNCNYVWIKYMYPNMCEQIQMVNIWMLLRYLNICCHSYIMNQAQISTEFSFIWYFMYFVMQQSTGDAYTDRSYCLKHAIILNIDLLSCFISVTVPNQKIFLIHWLNYMKNRSVQGTLVTQSRQTQSVSNRLRDTQTDGQWRNDTNGISLLFQRYKKYRHIFVKRFLLKCSTAQKILWFKK